MTRLTAVLVAAWLVGSFLVPSSVVELDGIELVHDVERDGPEFDNVLSAYPFIGNVSGFNKAGGGFTITVYPHGRVIGYWNCSNGPDVDTTVYQWTNTLGTTPRVLTISTLPEITSTTYPGAMMPGTHCWFTLQAVRSVDNVWAPIGFDLTDTYWWGDLPEAVDGDPEPSPSPSPTPTPAPTPPVFECRSKSPNWNGEGQCWLMPGLTTQANWSTLVDPYNGSTTSYPMSTQWRLKLIDHFPSGGTYSEGQVTYSGTSKVFAYTTGSDGCNVFFSAGNGATCTITPTGGAATASSGVRVGFDFNTTPWHNGLEHVQFQFYPLDGSGNWLDAPPSPTPTPTPTASPTPTPRPPGTDSPPPGEGGFDVCASNYTASEKLLCQPPLDLDLELCGDEDADLAVCQPVEPWDGPEGGGGGTDDGTPGGGGEGASGVAECPPTPVEQKVGFVAYDDVPDTDDLAARVDGKDPLAGLGEAVGWIGDMVWTLPSRFGNAIKWAYNQGVDALVPGECLGAIIEARFDTLREQLPFSLFFDVQDAVTAASSTGDGFTIPTWEGPGGVTVDFPVDEIAGAVEPYRDVLGAVVWLFGALAVMRLVAGTFGVKDAGGGGGGG